MNNWIHQLDRLFQYENRVVMVTVAKTKGSTPREIGAKFFVTAESIEGTIGGGNLEYQATQIARDLLQNNRNKKAQLTHFSLSAGLGMCCGGTVELIFECLSKQKSPWFDTWKNCYQQQVSSVLISRFDGSNVNKQVLSLSELQSKTFDMPKQIVDVALELELSSQSSRAQKASLIRRQNEDVFYIESLPQAVNTLYLFGAGHVGQAVVSLMSDLPWQIKWLDTRDECLDAQVLNNQLEHVNLFLTDTPESEIALAEAGSYYLVMTHDHALDLVLCEQIMKRNDAAYFGVIGSNTKRKRFEHRLSAKGYDKTALNKMICPIGIDGINSKQASSIALSVVAQLLQQSELNNNYNEQHLRARV